MARCRRRDILRWRFDRLGDSVEERGDEVTMRIKRFLERLPDDSGDYFSVWFEVIGAGQEQLEMNMKQGSSLMAQIAKCGLMAADVRNDPATPPDGGETMLTERTTHAQASYGPDGLPMIGFRFGRTALGVRLTIEQARELSAQLLALTTNT